MAKPKTSTPKFNPQVFKQDHQISVSEAAQVTGYKESGVIAYMNGYLYSERFFRLLGAHLGLAFDDFERKYIRNA